MEGGEKSRKVQKEGKRRREQKEVEEGGEYV